MCEDPDRTVPESRYLFDQLQASMPFNVDAVDNNSSRLVSVAYFASCVDGDRTNRTMFLSLLKYVRTSPSAIAALLRGRNFPSV
jgi:hypothetical protein